MSILPCKTDVMGGERHCRGLQMCPTDAKQRHGDDQPQVSRKNAPMTAFYTGKGSPFATGLNPHSNTVEKTLRHFERNSTNEKRPPPWLEGDGRTMNVTTPVFWELSAC